MASEKKEGPTKALASKDGPPEPRAVLSTDMLRTRVDYTRVPVSSKSSRTLKKVWRIVLAHPDPRRDVMGLEIYDDVVFGRGGGPKKDAPDKDLSVFDALERGVSRRHALLRPTRKQLFLIDMGSLNGTMVNGVPQSVGMARAIKHNDTLSLGDLHLTIKIMRRPDDAT